VPHSAWTLRDTPGIESLTHQGVQDWTIKRDVFRYRYLQEWNTVAPEMDVILCPVHPTPAPLPETTRYWGYTSLWNLLDHSAMTFPVTQVDPERDVKDPGYTSLNEFDSWVYEHYDVEKQKGVSACLQLVAKRLDEEKLWQAMREIKEKVGLPFKDCLG
jgi:Asp-tRNA(Asn)/Glu-tRNA(Gln) amidotransferase A subunit family amidase